MTSKKNVIKSFKQRVKELKKHSFFFDSHYINCESHLNGFTEEIYKEFEKKAKDLKLEQKINDCMNLAESNLNG